MQLQVFSDYVYVAQQFNNTLQMLLDPYFTSTSLEPTIKFQTKDENVYFVRYTF
jgi:hypothetical protein